MFESLAKEDIFSLTGSPLSGLPRYIWFSWQYWITLVLLGADLSVLVPLLFPGVAPALGVHQRVILL